MPKVTYFNKRTQAIASMSHVRYSHGYSEQESRAIERKLRDAATVLFGLKFADNIHSIRDKVILNTNVGLVKVPTM